MKKISVFLGALTCVVLTCAAPPIPVAPVAPGSGNVPVAAANGQLQVFSALRERREGDNPTWKQHTDYYVYNESGERVEQVKNTIGNYRQRPRVVSLPAGRYTVRAQSQDSGWVNVPVAIEDGRTTTLYLDDSWQPSGDARNVQAIRTAKGKTIGWSVN